jgi:hypothetical protein
LRTQLVGAFVRVGAAMADHGIGEGPDTQNNSSSRVYWSDLPPDAPARTTLPETRRI